MVHNVKLGKNMRSVSIVGIGATPFFNGVQNETYKGLTNGELFGHAALDAMKDAGVEPRDVQYFFHGSANPHVLNNCITPNLHDNCMCRQKKPCEESSANAARMAGGC